MGAGGRKTPGAVVVADFRNDCVRRVDADGVVTTLTQPPGGARVRPPTTPDRFIPRDPLGS